MSEKGFLRQRPLVCWAALFAAGILAARFLPRLNLIWPALGLALSLLAAALSIRDRSRRLSALCFAFLMLGALRGGLVMNPVLPEEGAYQVSGRVVGESRMSEDERRVTAVLEDLRLENDNARIRWLGRAYWTYYPASESPLPLDGQTAAFSGQVYLPKGQVNPYGFDFQDYLRQRGILIGISGNEGLMLSPEGMTAPKSPVLRLWQSAEARLDALFSERSGLAKALLTGTRDGIDERVNRDFRLAGIAHVLAVSGLHVGFLAAAILLLMKPFHPSPVLRLLILSTLLLAYCVLLDFTPSVLRAGILAVLLLSGKALKRRADPLTSLAAAFLLILILRPYDLFSLGFQLSFLAVLGIIVIGDRMEYGLGRMKAYQKLPSFVQKLARAYAVTLAASLTTLVPLVNGFHRVSLIGLLISPLAIALVGILMGGFAVCLLLSYVSLPLALFLAVPVRWFAALYEGMAGAFARAPYASLSLPFIHWPAAAAYYAVLWLSSRYAKIGWKARFIIAGGLAALALLFTGLKADNRVTYTQLSGGFEDSAVIMDGDTTFVLDTGENGFDLTSLLQSLGRRVDYLLISHLHSDHMGGLAQLIDSGLEIRRVLLPEGARTASDTDHSSDVPSLCEAAKIPVSVLKKGDVLRSGRVVCRVLWPYQGAVYPGLSANDGALVTLWDLNGVSLLSASDLSGRYAGYALEEADLLKVSHHGSKNDNTRELLEMVSPQIAMITADERQPERYWKTCEVLSGLGARPLVTGELGAITIKAEQGAIELLTHLPRRE